jgi:hypothetical protein
MPWYQATARLSDGFNAVTRVQAPSEDAARVWLRCQLSAQLADSPGSVGAITIRPTPAGAVS